MMLQTRSHIFQKNIKTKDQITPLLLFNQNFTIRLFCADDYFKE